MIASRLNVGDRVVMVYTRWKGRAGEVIGWRVVAGGGCGRRLLPVVRLDPTGRAPVRTIHCYASSLDIEVSGDA